MRARRILHWTAVSLAVTVLLVAVAAGGGWLWLRGKLRASLPALDGEIVLPGLSAPVTIERDAIGVPTVIGRQRLDLQSALGFLHAQERFFQMDLLRRQAAGELAELVGPAVVSHDERARVHRFRERARRNLDLAGPEALGILQAYAEGVNAGLSALGAKPLEYLVLRVDPRPWIPEDSLLVIMSIYLELQGYLWPREAARGVMHDTLPGELVEFLLPPGTMWDAPLDGHLFDIVSIPSAEVYDLRARTDRAIATRRPGAEELRRRIVAGSNNWAVAGTHTADGEALLANDMHLPLAMPNIWYRAIIVTTGAGGEVERRLAGVTLPGVPATVAGSNGSVAWGFTNSCGDWADLIVIEPDPTDPSRYLTDGGSLPFVRHDELVRVKGAADVTVEVTETIWGPVIDEDHRGRPRALRWVAHRAEAADMGLFELEQARTVQEALAVAAGTGLPAQNFVVADREGRIGWTLIGPIPRRHGGDATRPVPWHRAGGPWDDWLEPADYPSIVDPPSGRLWTANNRVVGPPLLDALGDGGFDLGARARQIRDDLLELERATPADLLAVQLDDRALFLERWRELLLDVLDHDAVAADTRRAELRSWVAEGWSGRAAVGSVGYRLVRAFRLFLAEQVFDAITAPCRETDERFSYQRATNQWEQPLWELVTERPPHLLDPRFESWDEQLLAAVDATLDHFVEDGDLDLGRRSWGQRNTVRVRHPLSLAVPRLSRWLDAAAQPLPGDSNMPRVQGPVFGASQRMVVSPGREETGLFHMPGGQSGHPLSPYYRAGHDAWARGEPAPLLPGPTEHVLTLRPSDAGGG